MIGYTGGTFSLFHKGHVNFLEKCKDLCRYLVVSLNTDEFIAQFKNRPPIDTFEERKAVLEACKYVDEVIPNYGGADSRIAIDVIEPDIIIIGSDWATKDYYKQMGFTQEWLDEKGIYLCYVPYHQGISTTDIKRRISEY
jgi:glycerol-3-phosphate cytidylyltransferase